MKTETKFKMTRNPELPSQIGIERVPVSPLQSVIDNMTAETSFNKRVKAEHAALVAVAELADKNLKLDCTDSELREALDNLAAVRGGKVVES